MTQTGRVGWIHILLGLILVGLAIRYWWVTVPVLLVGTAFVLWRRAQVQAHARQRLENARNAAEEAERAADGAERLAQDARIQRQARRLAMLEAGNKTEKATPVEDPLSPPETHQYKPTRAEDDETVETAARFEFDVALSFAGEDRAYVHQVAELLRARDVSVFYDEFFSSELWGEDMYVYFDDVFRRRARYVIVFISKHYVTKPWTNQERKSVQARFLHENTASLLPVRLDDSELPGLVPTVGYIDAYSLSIEALIGLIMRKLAGAQPSAPTPPTIDRVPRSKEEEALLLASRPPGWECLLFAAILLRERDALDPKLRDHAIGYARPEGPALDDQEASALLSTAFRHAQAIARNLDRILTPKAQELAFGRGDEPGDPGQIEHFAQRLIEIYRDFLDWASHLRGAAVPDHFDGAIEIASSFADQPICEMREFVDRTVAEMDCVPARLRGGETIEIKLRITLTIDEGLVAELNRELGSLLV